MVRNALKGFDKILADCMKSVARECQKVHPSKPLDTGVYDALRQLKEELVRRQKTDAELRAELARMMREYETK